MTSRSLVPVVAALTVLVAGCGPKMTRVSETVIIAEGAPPGPNSGVIKTSFGAVLVDGQPGYRAAEGLLKSARKQTGWEVAYVIMTSHHIDHSLGNEVFKKAEIISTDASRRAFMEKGESERNRLSDRLKLPGLKASELMPATLTFRKSMTLYAGWPKRKLVEIRMLEMPGGAAPGNLVVHLPKERVVFAGDLVVGGVFPYMADADVSAWVRALDEIDKLDCKLVVPGHGRSGGRAVVWETRKFLADLTAAILKARKAGVPAQQAKATFVLPGYEKWPGYKDLLPTAVERLWSQELSEIKLPPKPESDKPAGKKRGKKPAKPGPEPKPEPKPEKKPAGKRGKK